MTVERAKQILGYEASDLSDTQVSDILKSASGICSVLLDLAINDIVMETSAPRSHYGKDSNYLCQGK